jgi:hypothetical protein
MHRIAPKHMSPAWQMVISTILLVGLMLRGVIPVGFMPAVATDGYVDIVICTSNGVETITIDGNGETKSQRSPERQGDDGSMDAACPFGCLADHSSAAIKPSTAIEFNPTVQSFTATQSAFLLPPARAGPPLGAQAPPHIVA